MYLFAVEGLESLVDIDNLPDEILKKARQAINATADRSRTQASREIRSQLNFPARYLSDRLRVAKRASGASLSAVITGRDRPTSLARFATSQNVAASRRGEGVKVKVGNSTKTITKGFLINLRSGNIGLAMRLKPGESVRGKKMAAKMMAPNLYLLYGVSVDQAFQTQVDKGGLEKFAAEFLEKEFVRLMGI